MCFHILLCMSDVWVAVWVSSVVTQMLAKHMWFHTLLCMSVVWVPVCFGSWNTLPTGQLGEYSTSKIDWLVCLGNPNRNSNDTHAQKYMKTYMFCMHLSYYRGNSNRNSNPTQTHLIVKRTHFAVFELSETWDFIIFKRTSLKHPQSSKGRKKPCVSEF